MKTNIQYGLLSKVDESRQLKKIRCRLQVRAVACTLLYIQCHIYRRCDCEVGSNMSTKVGNSLSSLVDKQDIRCPSAEPSRTMSHQFHFLPLCSKSGLREKAPAWWQRERVTGLVGVVSDFPLLCLTARGLWRSSGSRRFRSSRAFVPSAPCRCCKLTAAG